MSEESKIYCIKLNRQKFIDLLLCYVNTKEIIIGVADDGEEAVCVLQTLPVSTEQPKTFGVKGEIKHIEADNLQLVSLH